MEKSIKKIITKPREVIYYEYYCDLCGKQINIPPYFEKYRIDSEYHSNLDLDLCLECINKINSEFDEALKPVIDKYKVYESKKEEEE